MRIPCSTILTSVLAGLAMTAPAAAQAFNFSCVKGNDKRSIEIVSPGEVGAACDVRYAQGGVTRTPYHANNTRSFCTEKAQEIVATLITSGFACGEVGGPLTAEARPADDLRDAQAESEPQTETLSQPALEPLPAPEPAPETVSLPEAAAPSQKEPASPLPPVETVTTPADNSAVTVPPAPTPAPEPDSLLGAAPIEEPYSPAGASSDLQAPAIGAVVEPLEPIITDDEIINAAPSAPIDAAATTPAFEETPMLDEPEATTVATRGPATLAGGGLEDLTRSAEPIVAGRIVGATPDANARPLPHTTQSLAGAAPSEPRPAISVQSISATDEAPAPASAPATAPIKTERLSRLRQPEDVIVATLNAQAAAWNEGNLPAFMEIYWKDDDLKFVSGTAVTRGWSSTMKRYRERYADEGGLGQLSFEKADVNMITDDVAVVTGRFNHVKNEDASSGVFTLVMKRIGGVWRIVHDHTANDPANG